MSAEDDDTKKKEDAEKAIGAVARGTNLSPAEIDELRERNNLPPASPSSD